MRSVDDVIPLKAKSGRLDVYRSAQELLRQCTTGRILLSLQPPPPAAVLEYASVPNGDCGVGSSTVDSGSAGLKAAVAALVETHFATQDQRGGAGAGGKKGLGGHGGGATPARRLDDVMIRFNALLADFGLDDDDADGATAGDAGNAAAVPSWLVHAFQKVVGAGAASTFDIPSTCSVKHPRVKNRRMRRAPCVAIRDAMEWGRLMGLSFVHPDSILSRCLPATIPCAYAAVLSTNAVTPRACFKGDRTALDAALFTWVN